MKKFTYLPNIQKLLTEFWDVLFPPSWEESILRATSFSKLKTLYEPKTFQKVTYLCEYAEPVIRAAVIENKFHNNRLAATYLRFFLNEWTTTLTQRTLFITIPLGKKRFRQRGHNQVDTIIKNVVPKKDIGTNLLRRRVETLPQSHLDKKLRQQNIHDVFEFTGTENSFSGYSQIVLVDDVVTTGATLNEARATLAPHIPPNTTLICLAIAH